MEAVILVRLAHLRAEFALEPDTYELLSEQLQAARSPAGESPAGEEFIRQLERMIGDCRARLGRAEHRSW